MVLPALDGGDRVEMYLCVMLAALHAAQHTYTRGDEYEMCLSAISIIYLAVVLVAVYCVVIVSITLWQRWCCCLVDSSSMGFLLLLLFHSSHFCYPLCYAMLCYYVLPFASAADSVCYIFCILALLFISRHSSCFHFLLTHSMWCLCGGFVVLC